LGINNSGQRKGNTNGVFILLWKKQRQKRFRKSQASGRSKEQILNILI